MKTNDHDKTESASSLQKHPISDSSEPEDHDQQQIQQPQAPSQISSVRSYECTFCKRGFSNAQALGGHMNIHRKHKAKLKHEETTHPQQQLYSPSTATTKEDPNTPTKSPWSWNAVPCQDQTGVAPKQVHQLPLFAERSSSDKDDQSEHQKELPSSEQLDLELRLGPEPNKDSSSTKETSTTRKFF